MSFSLKCLLLFCVFHYGIALKCYTCSVGETDTDKSCIDNVNVTTITTCSKKYCTIVRQELKDPKGKVASIYRGCEDNPIYKNNVIEDATYRIYYMACTFDLCNGGTGKSSANNNDNALGDKSTIYCPGIGNNSGIVKAPMNLLLLLTFKYLFLN